MLHPRAFLGFPLIVLWFSFVHAGNASQTAVSPAPPQIIEP
jgi:hypothetical protein